MTYEAGAGAGNNLFVRDLRQQGSQFIQLTDNMDFQYMPIYDEGGKIYIYTNYGAPKGRIMTADIRKPGVQDWQVLVAEQKNMLGSVGFTGDEKQPECFYTFTSFTMPGTIYRYDMAKNESTLSLSVSTRRRVTAAASLWPRCWRSRLTSTRSYCIM